MDLIKTALVVVVVVLFATGLIAMTVGNLMIAGMSFFSASVAIYFRENR
jgi:hypothetical protein